MNPTLPARATVLRERLASLDRTASNAAEASDLEGLRFELAANVAALTVHIEKAAILDAAAIQVELPASLIAARKKAKEILQKFVASSTAATLKRAQGWKTLLGEAAAAARDLGTANVAAWRSYRKEIFAGDPPAVVESRLAPTRPNVEAITKYRFLFDRLEAKFNTLPADRGAIDEAVVLASELETVAKEFDFDVPAEVKLFLEAVLSVSGAPLALLTPAVQAWLVDNNSFDNYRISATGRR